ncbi:OprD family outer membrane porin [Arcobacter arenosus]|uniref:OprD family porin n=1 Tax=Arcobacter arenosus TaxID=2576037 RepID=A0A5R8XYU2_9BACT|nr:OprD family outer membrane porin [Arcobacter arenosus]TLP36911.1 OprD family porin [Arcobacter arenosus]
MKLRTLSLMAILALNSQVMASDSLAEALTNGKVSGEVRLFTEMASNVDSTLVGPFRNANSSAVALQLNYSTGAYYGFKVNVGFQHGHSFDIENDSGAVSSGANAFATENDGRITQDGSMLYIANLQYNIAQTEFKVGRQGIVTPLIAVSNANPMKDTFEALSVVSKDLSNTEIRFYGIKKWIERYSATDETRKTNFDDPTLSLYVKNTSIPNLTLEGQYLAVRDDIGNPKNAPRATNDSYSTYFVQGDYKLPVDIPLSIGAYYAGTDYDGAVYIGATANDENARGGKGETTLYGVKIGGKVFDTAFKLAYTKVSDDNSFLGALGHTPHFFKYNGGQMFTDNIYAGQSSISAMVIPKLIPGVFTLFAYSRYSQTDKGQVVSGVDMDGASEIQADLRYKITKDLSARLQLAHVELDDSNATGNDDTMNIAKLYLTYKF